jgi:glycerol-3-phosphate dehydrogenase (NAD(P)+)
MKIAILGGGSWGLGLASHFINKNEVSIWEFFEDKALEMEKTRISPYLKGAVIDERISISSDIDKVIFNCDIILLVVPSDKIVSTVEKCKNVGQKQTFIICSKGFTTDLQLLSDSVKKIVSNEVYCFYGPTIAEEVYRNQFTGMVLAGPKRNLELKQALEDDTLVIELSDDIIGVQIGAALKNILAISIGMLDGMGQGENAKSYVITKGLQEIIKLGLAFGAKEETFYGLAGIGDIITTCFSEKSRNRTFGQHIGEGKTMDQALSEMNNVVEGLYALKALHEITKQKNIELPILNSIYRIIFENEKPTTFLGQ